MMAKPTLIIHWCVGATIAALLVSAAHAQTFQGQAVNVTQIKGATVDAGNGATSPATQRVTISSDSTGLVTTPAVGTNSTTAPTHSVLVGVSDSVNLQPLLAPLILTDGVNGNNMLSSGGYVWNGTSWDRRPGNVHYTPTDEFPSSYSHISTNTSTAIRTGATELHTITLNSVGSGSTATIYDNTTCTGAVVAVIDTSKQTGTSQRFDALLNTGLCVLTAGTSAADITVMWHPNY